ncbi:hypothetical protein PEP31012_03686 [Pandoraea eparura]|uniref:Uncharacterized protein n=1 Tax=Pandoraea eparura TaxID=2508291 RepID=A0A5E4X4Q1_9BURK|nr:hypothetical protein PEP31012_03686 [Pandoraea eparura]
MLDFRCHPSINTERGPYELFLRLSQKRSIDSSSTCEAESKSGARPSDPTWTRGSGRRERIGALHRGASNGIWLPPLGAGSGRKNPRHSCGCASHPAWTRELGSGVGDRLDKGAWLSVTLRRARSPAISLSRRSSNASSYVRSARITRRMALISGDSLKSHAPGTTFRCPCALLWDAGAWSEALFDNHPIDIWTEFFAKNRVACKALNFWAVLSRYPATFFAPLANSAFRHAKSACEFCC